MRLLLAIACIALSACYDAGSAERILANEGYTGVRTTGYAWFACDQHDTLATQFTATSAAGRRVTGAVCCGVIKNCTIRFDR